MISTNYHPDFNSGCSLQMASDMEPEHMYIEVGYAVHPVLILPLFDEMPPLEHHFNMLAILRWDGTIEHDYISIHSLN